MLVQKHLTLAISISLIFLIILFIMSHLIVRAAIITVDNTGDVAVTDGNCTLREAINNANANADTTGGDCAAGTGVDSITFSLPTTPDTIALTALLPTMIDAGDSVTGASTVIIDGGGSITIGLDAQADNITITGLGLTGFSTTAINVGTVDGVQIGAAGNGNSLYGNADAIRLNGSTNAIIEDNFIGLTEICDPTRTILPASLVGMSGTIDFPVDCNQTIPTNPIPVLSTGTVTLPVGYTAWLFVYSSDEIPNPLYYPQRDDNNCNIFPMENGDGTWDVEAYFGLPNTSEEFDVVLIAADAAADTFFEMWYETDCLGSFIGIPESTMATLNIHELAAITVHSVCSLVPMRNTGSGIILNSTNGVDILDNTIYCNGGHGILVTNASSNILIEGGSITNNGLNGLTVVNSSTVTVDSASDPVQIANNIGLGIDLDNNGVSPNGSATANGGQPFPNLLGAYYIDGTNAGGFVDFTDFGSDTYEFHFYNNVVCDEPALTSSGFGEGTIYLETQTLTNPISDTEYALGTPLTPGRFVTVLAVNISTGNTSEFSRCAPIVVLTASCNALPVTGAVPTIVNFDNLSSAEPRLTYLWDFGDGSTSTQFEPSHFYSASGTYTIALTVSGPGATQASATCQVNLTNAVLPPVVIQPTQIPTNNTVCIQYEGSQVEICTDASVYNIAQLPNTGERPLWATQYFVIGLVTLFVMISVLISWLHYRVELN